MTDTDVLNLMGKALAVATKIAGPTLLAVLLVGIVVSLLQAIFQVTDQALTFVPKIIVGVVVLVVGGAWMMDTMHTFVIEIWGMIPDLVRH